MKRHKPPMITIACRDVERIRVRADEHPDWSRCPEPDGWAHGAIAVYRVDIETPVGPYGWQIPADGPAPHPIAFGAAYVTTGDAWRYCSPELLVSYEYAGDAWPVWAPGVEPSDDVRDWWGEWIAEHSLELAESSHDEPYSHRFNRETAAPKDPKLPIWWFHLDEGDADREGGTWTDPRDGETHEQAAIRQAIEAVGTGAF